MDKLRKFGNPESLDESLAILTTLQTIGGLAPYKMKVSPLTGKREVFWFLPGLCFTLLVQAIFLACLFKIFEHWDELTTSNDGSNYTNLTVYVVRLLEILTTIASFVNVFYRRRELNQMAEFLDRLDIVLLQMNQRRFFRKLLLSTLVWTLAFLVFYIGFCRILVKEVQLTTNSIWHSLAIVTSQTYMGMELLRFFVWNYFILWCFRMMNQQLVEDQSEINLD